MKYFLLTVLITIVACNVRKLTDSDFDDVVGGDKDVFVKFFAPWCGHCKALAPDYETVAEKFLGSNKVVIAEVDCDAEKTVCSKFGVQGYPTLKYFPKKTTTPLDYNGGRSVDDLTTYVENRSGAKAKGGKKTKVEALNAQNFDKVVNDETKDVMVKFYAPWCGHCKALAPKYEKVAEIFSSDENVVLAEVNCDAAENKDLCGKYEIHGYPTLKFFSKKNKEGVSYDLGREEKDFIEYFNKNAGTQRTEDGKLSATAGIIEDLKGAVKTFMDAADKKEAMAKALEAIKSRTEDTAFYYEKVILKIVEKGVDWIKTEKERLGKLVEEKGVARKKIDAFWKSINILNEFL